VLLQRYRYVELVMASFIPPKIQDNPNGWGPNDPPEQFKDLPYAPFSKGDRLGKVVLKGTGYSCASTLGDFTF